MISKAAHRILAAMVEHEAREDFEAAQLVREGRQCWLGEKRTTSKVVNELLMLCLVSSQSEQGSPLERYSINEDGRKAALNPGHAPPAILDALKARAVERLKKFAVR
jgi:hypothetical protein